MNRRDLQELTRIRAVEAGTLLDQGMYDGAYYLSGYAVECALKACISTLLDSRTSGRAGVRLAPRGPVRLVDVIDRRQAGALARRSDLALHRHPARQRL